MSNSKSTRVRLQARKPRPDFPLFPHQSGRWAKKIKGKLVYFGSTRDDPDGQRALERWLDAKDDLLAGRQPRASSEGVTVRDLLNAFLTFKQRALEAGELVDRTFYEYHAVCKQIGDDIGLTTPVTSLCPADFEKFRAALSRRLGPVALGNVVQKVRTVFKYGLDSELLDKPVRFGLGFKKPSKRILRQERQQRGSRLFEAAEIRAIIAAAEQPIRAMVLLAINCGLGNHDVGSLTIGALDLEGQWLNYPRPKTAIPRRIPLWDQTVEAIREAIAAKPKPRDPPYADLVFLTRWGGPWGDGNSATALSARFTLLLKSLGLHRPGRSFYSIRHCFATIADGAKDPVARRALMGHAAPDSDIGAVYSEQIDDSRRVAVVEHVRRWLLANEVKPTAISLGPRPLLLADQRNEEGRP